MLRVFARQILRAGIWHRASGHRITPPLVLLPRSALRRCNSWSSPLECERALPVVSTMSNGIYERRSSPLNLVQRLVSRIFDFCIYRIRFLWLARRAGPSLIFKKT